MASSAAVAPALRSRTGRGLRAVVASVTKTGWPCKARSAQSDSHGSLLIPVVGRFAFMVPSPAEIDDEISMRSHLGKALAKSRRRWHLPPLMNEIQLIHDPGHFLVLRRHAHKHSTRFLQSIVIRNRAKLPGVRPIARRQLRLIAHRLSPGNVLHAQ